MPAWLSILAVAVVFVGFLASSAVYLRGSKDKGTIDMLNRHSAAQDIEIGDLQEEVERLSRENARQRERISAVEKDNVSLAAERPSRERLTEIHDVLTGFVESSEKADGEIKALLMALARLIQPEDE